MSKYILVFLITFGFLQNNLEGFTGTRMRKAISSIPASVSVSVTSGATWSVPADFGPTNTIECIGGGEGGWNGGGGHSGGGGNGGSYAKLVNYAFKPSTSVSISIGAGGAVETAGGDTWFGSSTTLMAPGGGSSNDIGAGDFVNYGGYGGSGGGGTAGGGGGGGGGGPNGRGKNGGDGSGTNQRGGGGGGHGGGTAGSAGVSGAGGAGGNNYLGTGGGVPSAGAGGAGSAGGGGAGGRTGAGGSGGAGLDITATAGSGGGGGGGAGGQLGGLGGTYGGGGGGGGPNSNGRAGAAGVCFITYTPAGTADHIPSAVDWTNFNDQSSALTITNLTYTQLEVSAAYTSGTPSIGVSVNGGTYEPVTPTEPAKITVKSGDTVQFAVGGTSTHSATITVKNVFDSNTVLDTVVGTVSNTVCTKKTANRAIASDADDGYFGDGLFYQSGWNNETTWAGHYNVTERAYLRFQVPQAMAQKSLMISSKINLYASAESNWSGSNFLYVALENGAAPTQVAGMADEFIIGSNGRTHNKILRWPESGGFTWTIASWQATRDLNPLVATALKKYSGLTTSNYLQFWMWGTAVNTEIAWEDYNYGSPASRQPSLDLTWAECP